MNNISICVVTFRQRLDLIKNLINKIRINVPNNVDILLVANGNNEEDMPEDYRKEILNLSLSYNNIYPIICPEFKSLCKLWNTLVIFSKTEYNFIICDDVEYENDKILNQIMDYINQTNCEFFTINNGFSHFVLTKTILHKLNYFDERLIGFGEEDGDIVHKYISMFKKSINNININGLYNKASYDLKNEKIETHVDNKPRFNREFIYNKYKQDMNGIYGMSPVPVVRVMEDINQYPYEMFVKNNKHNLSKFDKINFSYE